jgi:hypothetical protein
MLPAQLLSVLHCRLCMPSSYPPFANAKDGAPATAVALQFEDRATPRKNARMGHPWFGYEDRENQILQSVGHPAAPNRAIPSGTHRLRPPTTGLQ